MDTLMYKECAHFQDRHWYFIGMREILFDLVRQEEMPGFPTILDVGCGTGPFFRGLSRWGKIIGVDIAKEALSLIPKDSSPALIQADVRILPFKDESFDLVWASSIIEHLRDDFYGLKEMVRVLKPGGWVMLAVPAHRALWGHHDELVHHLRRYSREELKELCLKSGLRIQKITHYGMILSPLAFLVRKIQNALGIFWPRLKRISDFQLAFFPRVGWLFLFVLRLEKLWLRRVNLPFGLMLFALAEKLGDPKGSHYE